MKNIAVYSRGTGTEDELLGTDQYLKQLVRLLVEFYDPVKIYLFDSKARGDQGPHSDYDLMVVVRKKIIGADVKSFTMRSGMRALEKRPILYFGVQSRLRNNRI